MHEIVILTATYNHPENIKGLYRSLLKQSNPDFSWVVVNDGSERETEEVLDSFKIEGKIDITIINQKNAGKGRATNRGLDSLTSSAEFVVIIDDDEQLMENAVSTIKSYYEKYKKTACVAINFNRRDESGNIIANPVIDEDYFMSVQRHTSMKRTAGGYIAYFLDKLGDKRFSDYEGEKYIAPSTLMMKATDDSSLLWAKAVLGDTEFLAGGITKQGRRLRVKNPKGMIEYCNLMQNSGSSLWNKFAYSVHGYAYYYLQDKAARNDKLQLIHVASLPGFMLSIYWKKKLLK